MDAVIYARYSSDNQSEESIQAQLRACGEYAMRNNITIIDTYIDRAQSARSDKRESFQKMIADSAEKSFSAVIVHKLDRFSRDRYDHAVYRKKLRENGVKLISVLENLDDSPESVVLESVLEGFSEYYSKNLARETRKGLKEVALKAKFTGGTPPFGFDVDPDNNYIINEKEAEAVKKIFSACLNDVGYAQLIKEFDEKGIRTKFGRPFNKSSFNAILKNQKYIGTYIYYPVGTYREKRSEPIVIEDALPAIIPKKIFWEVQEKMKSRKHSGRVRAIEPYILSGILFCGECGSPMNGHRHSKNDKHYYDYECGKNTRSKRCDNRTFSRDKLEGLVCDYISRLLSDETIDEIKGYISKNIELINKNKAQKAAELKRELSALERQINSTMTLLIEMPSDNLKQRLMDLERRQKALSLEIEKTEDSEITENKLNEYVIRIKNFDALDRTQKQIFAKKLIKKVTAYKNGQIEIESVYGKITAAIRVEDTETVKSDGDENEEARKNGEPRTGFPGIVGGATQI